MRSVFIAPGRYRIRVNGRLDARWSELLGGLCLSEWQHGDESGTELTGWLPDQAALNGVLNTLYNHRCALLRVEYLGPAGDSVSGQDESAAA